MSTRFLKMSTFVLAHLASMFLIVRGSQVQNYFAIVAGLAILFSPVEWWADWTDK